MAFPMDRAEATFEAIMQELDKRQVGSWSKQELSVFVALLEEYQRTAAIHKGHAKDDHGEGEDYASHDEEDSMEMAVAEVDRDLTRIRTYLKKNKKLDPTHEPSTKAYGTDSSAKEKKRGVVCHPPNTAPSYTVDAFLYLDEDVEELVSEGKLSREYCRNCGSTDVGLVDYVTHSFSQDQLIFLGCFLLPSLTKEQSGGGRKVVVDVGSRLGVVLWSCYFAAQQGLLAGVSEVVGVELDKSYAALQREVGMRYCARPVQFSSSSTGSVTTLTCRVVESDCFEGNGAKALQEADIVILNNVFEYFCGSAEEHLRCWEKLRNIVKRRGQLLICSPSLEETLTHIEENVWETVVGHSSKKRSRDGGGITSATRTKDWLTGYLEEVDVSLVREAFLQFRALERTPSAEDNCRDDHCGRTASHINDGHAHGDDCRCCGEVGGEESAMSELEEQIHAIHVYRVI